MGKCINHKFGESSIGNSTETDRAVHLVADQAAVGVQIIVMVSSMAGITNQLTTGAEQVANLKSGTDQAAISVLRAKFQDVILR